MTNLENLYERLRELNEEERILTEQFKNEKDENKGWALIFERKWIRDKIRVTQRQIELEKAQEAFKKYKKRLEG